jgi:serine protease 16
VFNSNDALEINKLSTLFNSCTNITSPLDQTNFAGAVAGTFQGTVQYNEDYPVTIATLCDFMLNASNGATAMDKLAKLTTEGSDECMDYTWASSVTQLQNITVDPSQPVGDRQWIYQTCTQFGYYQTCEPWKGSCLFSPRMDLESNTLLCKQLFGLDVANVEDRILFSNDYYGGNTPDASRIIFVNGDIDPWHVLSVLESDEEQDITSILIHGGSHCQNMYAFNATTNSFYMQEAKLQIQSIVGKWVQDIHS